MYNNIVVLGGDPEEFIRWLEETISRPQDLRALAREKAIETVGGEYDLAVERRDGKLVAVAARSPDGAMGAVKKVGEDDDLLVSFAARTDQLVYRSNTYDDPSDLSKPLCPAHVVLALLVLVEEEEGKQPDPERVTGFEFLHLFDIPEPKDMFRYELV